MTRDKQKQRTKLLHIAFDITPSEWELVALLQGGVCFVCGRRPAGKRLATDHDHETGLFRGLLCNRCNALLGKLENNFKRYGLHKIPGLTLDHVLMRIRAYLANPPAVKALGRQAYGYPGRIGTIAYRKWAKKKSMETR